MTKHKASCRCGNVLIRAKGEPNRVGICHCMDCRKYHAAPFHASAIFPKDVVDILGESAEFEGRSFCSRCGSPLFAISGDEIEISIGAFDQPNVFVPTYESWTIRRENWLPELPGTRKYDQDRSEPDPLKA